MSRVTIEWTIRADGHNEGDRQTVERTAYVEALIRGGRVEVLEVHEDPKPAPAPAPLIEEPLDAEDVSLVPNDVPDAPVGEPGAEGLTVPAPKPRGPRRDIQPTKYK